MDLLLLLGKPIHPWHELCSISLPLLALKLKPFVAHKLKLRLQVLNLLLQLLNRGLLPATFHDEVLVLAMHSFPFLQPLLHLLNLGPQLQAFLVLLFDDILLPLV